MQACCVGPVVVAAAVFVFFLLLLAVVVVVVVAVGVAVIAFVIVVGERFKRSIVQGRKRSLSTAGSTPNAVMDNII